MRLKLIACDIFTREVCAVVLQSSRTIDVEFLPKGLHDIGAQKMQARLQEVLNRVDESIYEAILFGYGLCNNGLVGLTARSVPIVIPRAHDCISVFMGSKEKYRDYFTAHPGTYYLTSGWVERGSAPGELGQQGIGAQMGMHLSYEELVEKYGEDNAAFLYEELTGWTRNYSHMTYIDMGLGSDARYEAEGQAQAKEKGWEYNRLEGDISMLQRLVDGSWPDEEFLVVPPGHKVAPSYDEKIIKAVPIT